MPLIALLLLELSILCFCACAGETNARDVIKPGDDLSLTVLNEPDLSFDLQRVDQEGGLTIALLGRVQLAGKSVKDANAEITAAFAKGYLINPGVALNIVSYGEYQTVSVQGKVLQPGAVSFRKGEWIDALRAIQRAGGLTDPKVRKVVLKRSGAPDSVGDTARMLDGKQARMTLRDGDVLLVGE
jgi:polysaccharide export outer membrane protein